MGLVPNMTKYIYNRYWLYLGAAVFAAAQSQLGSVIDGTLRLDSVAAWVLFFVNLIVPGIVATLAFIDQTMSQRKEDQ